MTWVILLLILTIFMIAALGIGLFGLFEHATNSYMALEKSIKDTHAQVINAEKISRYSLDASNAIVESFKKIADNNVDIHNVCTMIAREIQAAKEAQKRI